MPDPVVCPACFDGMHSACIGSNGCYCDCQLEPAPPHQFVHIGTKVMQGSIQRAAACSKTFARRIANALNRYTPNDRGY